MHRLQTPNCSPHLVAFSDPEMDTYCFLTEMAQEDASLFLSILVLLVKQLMEDSLYHRVGGSTFYSQALSSSPAIHSITCHSGVKKKVWSGDLFPSSPCPWRISLWMGFQGSYLPRDFMLLCSTQSKNAILYLTHIPMEPIKVLNRNWKLYNE